MYQHQVADNHGTVLIQPVALQANAFVKILLGILFCGVK